MIKKIITNLCIFLKPRYKQRKKNQGKYIPQSEEKWDSQKFTPTGVSTMHHIGLKIFLSSTFSDLFMERHAVEAVINRMALTYVGMEHFGSFSKLPLDQCLEKVRSSDVFIIVLGNRYGSKPAGKLISFTEAEYREAKQYGKFILAYLADCHRDDDAVDDASALSRFKDELLNSLGVSEFKSPEDLAWKVASDLYRELPLFQLTDVPSLQGRTKELIKLFERRARAIKRDLVLHYKYTEVKSYLDEFDDLHKAHLSYLKNGDIVLAHEVLNQIHYLSWRLEKEEFWNRHYAETPFFHYCLSLDQFTHGPMTAYGIESPWSLLGVGKDRSATDVYTGALASQCYYNRSLSGFWPKKQKLRYPFSFNRS